MSFGNDQNQEVVIVIIFGIIIFLALTTIIVFVMLHYQKRRFQYKKEKADMESVFEKSLLQSKIEIQENAFNEISRELHDNVGQQLTLAKLHLNTLQNDYPREDAEKIDTVKNLVTETIYQIRNISKTLLGEKISDIGIRDAIAVEVERINKLHLCNISFEEDADFPKLNPQSEIILFRLIQEALNNVMKHAYATNILISLRHDDAKAVVSIADDGRGFDTHTAPNGVGLINMKSRAAIIGSELYIYSEVGKGTNIEVAIPKT